ncbi:MAG: hypothetical protein ACOY3P_06260 [Planctomycetota bacterium]
MPVEAHGPQFLAGDVLADEEFEEFVAHPLPAGYGQQFLLVQVVAVAAAEVAGRADGLADDVERPPRAVVCCRGGWVVCCVHRG